VTKADFEPMTVRHAPRTRAYVKIEDGCESKCTYCAISGARGRVRSKPRWEVIKEVEALYASGTREIVLTGIETGSYGRDFEEKYDLADLICELDRRGSCERLRLGSLAPELINKSFVERVKGARILCPHFHLSLQSGSNAVLNRMKRRYSREMAMAVIEDIRANIKGAAFTTDLMVGFPGETDEDFLLTVDFARRARLLDAHVFAYSKREGTPAADYPDQIPEDTKKERSEALIRIKNEIREELLSEILASGEELVAIAESRGEGNLWSAHTASFIEVAFDYDGEISGEVVKLRPVHQKCGILYCDFIAKI
jgi:threonylcarbamoyladenosine tRNA methylthiotransferase MtaB